NTFGTPEEDAFRRDFTINALFYDIATFAVIDYVGGLEDLRAGVVRSIGDPDVRLREDPVRMLRAIALAARLGFTIEPRLVAAIRTHRHEIAKSSMPRLLEEYYKILRAGSSERAFRGLAEVGLLEPISSELHLGATERLWTSLAGRDVERLRQIVGLQRRLKDVGASPRAQRALAHRGIFRDALTWFEIHGGAPELVAYWKQVAAESGSAGDATAPDGSGPNDQQ